MDSENSETDVRQRLHELEAKIEAGLPELRKICNASDYDLLVLSMSLAELTPKQIEIANTHAANVIKMDKRKPVYTDWLLAVAKAKEATE